MTGKNLPAILDLYKKQSANHIINDLEVLSGWLVW
jgi:hypothetical protein